MTIHLGLVDQLERAIECRDFGEAARLLGAFRAQQRGMLSSYFEWIDHWVYRVRKRLGPAAGTELRTVRRRWERLVRTCASPRIIAQIEACVSRSPQPSDAFQIRALSSSFATTDLAIRRCARGQALHAVEVCVGTVRQVHDALVGYVAALGEHVFTHCGVEVGAEDALASLSACSYFAPAWEALLSGPPDAVAAAIVEEFQAHLSGPGRKGRVAVEEDEDKYRIVLDPCGSGGAMRRRSETAGVQSSTIPTPSPVTWSIGRSVPPYCSHCAQNELTAFARTGQLVWTTAFTPDPQQPCGWIVFKHRDAIPAHFYDRLGLPHPTGEP